jgi:hypothetical protein
MTTEMNPFRAGDLVILDTRAVKGQFKIDYEDYPWRVTRIKDDLVYVERKGKSGRIWHPHYWYGFFRFADPTTAPKREFSESQEIALEEIIRRVVRKMDSEGFFNHDHEDGEQIHFVDRDEEDAQKVKA